MITNQLARQDFLGNGTAGPFSFQFMIASTNDLLVYVDGALKTFTTHYTVSGAGSESGFTITFTTGNEPATNAKCTVIRNEPLTQTLDLQRAGNFPSQAAEAQWDKGIRLMQQLHERVNRAPVMSVPDSRGLDPIVLGAPSAGKYLRWDSLGKNVEASTPTTVPSGLPVGGNYDHLIIDGTGATTWGQQVYNFAANWVNISKYGNTLSTAVSAIGSTLTTLVISSNVNVTGNVSVPETLRLMFVGQGKLTISGGVTVTIAHPDQISASPRDNWIAGSGTVAFASPGVVHVGWWGAKPDGVTASATAIQSAIDAAPQNSVVVLQGGTYAVASTLTINKERIVLKGAGRSSTKIVSTVVGAPTIKYNTESIHNYIQDLWLSGNGLTGASGNGHAIAFIDPTPGSGAYAPQTSYVLNCRIDGFKGNDTNGRGGTMLACGVFQISTLEVTIKDCFIENCQHGLFIDSCFAPRIYDNVIIDHVKYGILVVGTDNVIENLFMSGNDFLNSGDSGTFSQTGWTTAPTGNAYFYRVEGGSISGNKFKNGDLSNVVFAYCKGLSIHGNWIRADNQYGAIFRACHGVSIMGNSFDCSTGSTNTPEYLTFQCVGGKDSNGIVVRGNVFRFQGNKNVTHCIKIEGDASARRFQACAIDENYFGDVDLVGPTTITNAINVVQVTLSACSISRNVFYAETNATITTCFRTDANTNFIEFSFNGNQFQTNGGTITNQKVIAVGTFAQIFQGTGTPEANVTAFIGSLYMRLDGGAGTSLYVKESGTGNTGWSDVA